MSPFRGNILVVDDAPANLHLLSGMLKEKGYKARPVPSGRLALRAARSEPPDLILLDINMPEMDGYEVCRRLKQDHRLKEIPVIFISALSETLDKVKAFTVGGVDYVTKPLRFEEVEARIDTHLQLRQMQKELQQNYDRLRELETLRDNLTHMIVHDMRSPLMALASSLQLLEMDLQGKVPDENMDDIENARASSTVLIRMVSDLLDVSRLEARQMPLKLEQGDLKSIADQAVTAVKGLTPGRQVELSGSEELLVLCDREVMRRVLENLIGNGLKHTPKGVKLRIHLQQIQEGVRVEVSDSGPGIPAEYQQKIFEKFGQVEPCKESKYHSTGLGLAFCKLAVEAHGGHIGVESEEGQGSTFWVTLPSRLRPVAEPPASSLRAVRR